MKKKNRTQYAAIVRNDPKRLHTGGTIAFPWMAGVKARAAVRFGRLPGLAKCGAL